MATEKTNWGDIAIGAIFWGFVAAIIFWSPISDAVNSNRVTCADVSIPYSTNTTVVDPDLPDGTSEVTQQGVNGTKNVCKKGDGTIVSSKVTTKPIEQVTAYGMKEFAPEPVETAPVEQSTHCAVTLCNDGTCSFSQGRGTCSWHGGVAQYY